MIKRNLEKKIISHLNQYPVITIIGPRQSGKTTLVRSLFFDLPYYSLEDFDHREYAESDPRGFLDQFENGGIIDEVQRVPQLLSYIQTIVDQKKKKGQFILTGSNQFLLLNKITQSLAGRVSLLKLLPFEYSEIKNTEYSNINLNQLIFKGLYPRIYDENLNPSEWYLNYIETYIERDLREIKNIVSLAQFRKFLQYLPSLIGQTLNYSSIANAIGVSHNTIRSWLSILEASFIIFLLQPHFKNYKKRIVKNPKLYFWDTGLACALLRIKKSSQISNHFIKGSLFENFIISEMFKSQYHSGRNPDFYFWRDHTGHEIDLIYDSGLSLYPTEIKLSQTIHSDFFNHLRYYRKLSEITEEECFLIYGGEKTQKRYNVNVLPWEKLDVYKKLWREDS